MTEAEAPELSRSERRRLETRQALLDAVIDLLLETDDPRLSTSDIADRADVAVGTFYNHFLSVPDAIEAAFEHLTPNFAASAAAMVEIDDVAVGFGHAMGGFFCRLNEAPRIWKAARVAGWNIRPTPEFLLVRSFQAAGIGIETASEAEVEATANFICRLMTSMVDHFGQDDVRPHLPGQATRILASALITDPDAIERAAEAAERHYDELMSQPGGVGEVGLFSSPG